MLQLEFQHLGVVTQVLSAGLSSWRGWIWLNKGMNWRYLKSTVTEHALRVLVLHNGSYFFKAHWKGRDRCPGSSASWILMDQLKRCTDPMFMFFQESWLEYMCNKMSCARYPFLGFHSPHHKELIERLPEDQRSALTQQASDLRERGLVATYVWYSSWSDFQIHVMEEKRKFVPCVVIRTERRHPRHLQSHTQKTLCQTSLLTQEVASLGNPCDFLGESL